VRQEKAEANLTEATAVDQIQIVDSEGRERDWNWLLTRFGPVAVQRSQAFEAGGTAYRLIRLRETTGPAVQSVHVTNKEGKPLKGILVVRHTPDAPDLPRWPVPASCWRDRGVFGPTGDDGAAVFGLGPADGYTLPGPGTGSVWVSDASGPSDLLTGLGALASAQPRHLDLTFQLLRADEAPSVPLRATRASAPAAVQAPTLLPSAAALASAPSSLSDEQWSHLIQRLDRIMDSLEKRLAR
jgi:hypothetical protein